ncbi:MAG: hypothetical protein V1249_01365, partial [Acidimicrobiales bacterium]|nr:hypothetical protein [Acidimicrobiales bacterium]
DDLQFMLAYLGRAHTVSTFANNHLELAERIRKGAPEALESLEYDLSEFGVPPLLGALAELDTAKAHNDFRQSR